MTALLSTRDVIVALVAIGAALATVTKYVLIPLSKLLITIYQQYRKIGTIDAEIKSLRSLVGDNGKESVFQMLHGLKDTQAAHSATLQAQNKTLERQNVTLAEQSASLAAAETSLEVLMNR